MQMVLVDMCKIRVTSEPFEVTDGIVAIGAKVRHILQAIHAEGNQATAIHAAVIKDTGTPNIAYIPNIA